MPAKNISAVQRLAQSLRMGQRQYSRRNLLPSKDSFDANKVMLDQRIWPKREEAFAAAQLLRQNRNWSLVRKYGNNFVSNMVQSRRGTVPRRNNIIASKNAKRNALKEEIMSKLMSKNKELEEGNKESWNMSIVDRHENVHENKQEQQGEYRQRNDEQHQHQQQQQQERLNQQQQYPEQSQERQHQREKNALDDDYRPRDVRDVVFGVQDNNEEDIKRQREADNDLLERIFKTRSKSSDPSKISKKVIAPYLTYKSHRNSWAEFRHRMIYGGSPF